MANGYARYSGLVVSGGGGGGGVTAVTASSPIASSGGSTPNISLTGIVPIANGGTGQSTAPNAINALLPSQGGNSGKVLGTNGTVASWVASGSGTPGGANTNVQFNNSGAFGGSSDFTFDDSTNAMTQGAGNTATGVDSSAQGFNNTASGNQSHASGANCIASAGTAHAEGNTTTASGARSHSEGSGTLASALASHAEGLNTQANGLHSHSAGEGTIANGDNQTVVGQYNVVATNEMFSVGNGSGVGSENTALAVLLDGSINVDGSVGTSGQVLVSNGSGSPASWSTVANGISIGDSVGSGTEGSVLFLGPSGVLAQDNANFFWDDSTNRLLIGDQPGLTGDVNGFVRTNGTITDPTSAVYGIYVGGIDAVFTTSSPAAIIGTALYPKVEVPASESIGGFVGSFMSMGRVDASDGGSVPLSAGYLAQFNTGNSATKNTGIYAAFMSGLHQADSNANQITSMYDFYGQASSIAAGAVTNMYGIVIEPDSGYTKKNWLSGNVVLGGSSYTPPTETVHVDGDVSATKSATDNVAVASLFTASTNTTVDNSDNTTAVQGVATATVQSGATNDKNVSGIINTVTRGDGTDDGTLSAMLGSLSLLFHNSGTSGVTNESYGFSSVLVTQQGTITNHYDYFSQRSAAGGTLTNHYGVYLSNDSTTPIKSWMSGSTLFGGTSFSSPAETVDVVGSVRVDTSVKFLESGGPSAVSISAPTLAGDIDFVLPPDEGNNGDVLTSDGAGNTSWAVAPSAITNNYYSGFTSSAASWTTTSATYVDGTNTGGNSLTSRISNVLSVSAGASNVAGITFTPASASDVFIIKASFPGQGATNGATAAFRLYDGTSVIDTASNTATASGGTQEVCLEGLYAPGTTSAVIVKVQMAAIGGGTTNIADPTAGLNPVIEWSIVQIK